ncbi:MAG: hypothetical protein NT051_00695 [Candidatus Micrarchaeota archaeon]|nr:hypothetical protein [Candidatus Micrarchaeota archaeon]
MAEIRLNYRVAETHTGKGRVNTPGAITQPFNEYWSYFRHLPSDWDNSKIARRANVAGRLLENLKLAGKGEMDLGPLKDDQRASGTVYGASPLQLMYDVVSKLARENPNYPFFGKWGGYQPEKEGKRFVFYVENEQDAFFIIEKVNGISRHMGEKIEISHQYGLTDYAAFVNIDKNLRSKVTNPQKFEFLLERLLDFPHFFH